MSMHLPADQQPWGRVQRDDDSPAVDHLVVDSNTMNSAHGQGGGVAAHAASSANIFDHARLTIASAALNGQTMTSGVSNMSPGEFSLQNQNSLAFQNIHHFNHNPHQSVDDNAAAQEPSINTATTNSTRQEGSSTDPWLASQGPSTITSHPTLLPKTNTISRDTHDPPRFGSGIEELFSLTQSNSLAEGVQSLFPADHSITKHPPAEEAKEEITTLIEHDRFEGSSTVEYLSGPNMGYCNETSSSPSPWNSATEQQHTPNKMEDQTDQTGSERSFQGTERKDEQDDTTVLSLDSVVGSPASASLNGQNIAEAPGATGQALGTPSTVSTAPSTTEDEASVGMDANTMDRLALKVDFNNGQAVGGEQMNQQGSMYQHRSVQPAWEEAQQQPAQFISRDSDHGFGNHSLPAAYSPPQPAPTNAWGNVHLGPQHQQQRVASFRNEPESEALHGYGYLPPMNSNLPVENRWQQQPPPHADNRWQQQQQQQQPPPRYQGEPPLPFVTGRRGAPMDNRMYRAAPQPGFNPYPQPARKPANVYAQTVLSPSATPPRGHGRNQRPHGHGPSPHRPSPQASGGASGQAHQGSANSRSSSEVLKTLLRKKACLYEPDTSRAVALVTWLVGRELALSYGFFSRQQLQAGVHACVAEKIDSGVITRTKVNRCMQIILNSCFHYIIPRPDGTEENGDAFRSEFAAEVEDNTVLLQVLPPPWNDLRIDKEAILTASLVDVDNPKNKKASPVATPQSSPHLGSVDPGLGPGKDSDDGDNKRAVLLCFNENVRCAEDVFRCHNEFIRDTAHASSLQLSSAEWRLFFGKDAAGAPYLWGNIGIPVAASDGFGGNQNDAVGMMTATEVAKFRTTWCAKRYDHDHELCGFAHVKVNGGWLRRNPELYNYRDEMCPAVTRMKSPRSGSSNVYMIHECPKGINCEYAHSVEEIVYHPRRYKSKTCACLARPGTHCHMGDACPDMHPIDSYRFPKKADGRSGPRHGRQSQHGGGGKGLPLTPPKGAPILYASPAPPSSFEEHLALPGLKNLYRRHCAVVRRNLRAPGSVSLYSYFGDDWGVSPNKKAGSDAIGKNKLPQPVNALPTAMFG